MDPAQAPNLTSNSSTGVTAAMSNRPGAPSPVPPAPELRASLFRDEAQAQPSGDQPSANRVSHQSATAARATTLPERSPLLAAWPRSAQLTTAFLLGIVATLLVSNYLSSTRSGTRPADLERRGLFAYRVDLNEAPVAELEQIPNIGPKRAAKIDAYRRLHGPFRSVEDLRKVPGFGAVTVERLRDHVTVRTDEPDRDRPESPLPTTKVPQKRAGVGKKEVALQGVLIDVNRASLQDLQRLPRIGPKMAQRIVDERARGRFKTVAELRRVSGIGPKTLERLRPYVTVGNDAQVAAAQED